MRPVSLSVDESGNFLPIFLPDALKQRDHNNVVMMTVTDSAP